MSKGQSFLVPFSNWYEKNTQTIFRDFFHFLSFPTVSAKKESLPTLERCADFLKHEYEKIGFEVEKIKTKFAPCLIAQKLLDPSYETVLFYHHYDVQPEDPLELWESNPFEAEIKNDAVYARGAQDNKGQCFYTLTALKAIFELQVDLKVNIKVIIEGEEEVGSTHLKDVLSSHGTLLRADHLFVVDSGMKSLKNPVIAIGARGILTYELTVTTQETDLHSGEHGGVAFSATRALIDLLSKCYDESGRVVIDGFYDGVKSNQLDPNLFDLEFDEKSYKNLFGIKVMGTLPDRTAIESNWIYPTLEINGMWGGYLEQGFKTVLPAKAHAKLSIRSVPNQDPIKLSEALHRHLEKVKKKGLEIEFKILSLGDFVVSSENSRCVQVAKQAYTDVFGSPCKLSLCGGSIPITAKLAAVSKAQAVLIGTGLMDDNIHAPNEHFQLESFRKGFLTIVRILDILGKI